MKSSQLVKSAKLWAMCFLHHESVLEVSLTAETQRLASALLNVNAHSSHAEAIFWQLSERVSIELRQTLSELWSNFRGPTFNYEHIEVLNKGKNDKPTIKRRESEKGGHWRTLTTMLDGDDSSWPEERRRRVAAERLSVYLEGISDHTRRTLPGRTSWTEALVRAFCQVRLGIALPPVKQNKGGSQTNRARRRLKRRWTRHMPGGWKLARVASSSGNTVSSASSKVTMRSYELNFCDRGGRSSTRLQANLANERATRHNGRAATGWRQRFQVLRRLWFTSNSI